MFSLIEDGEQDNLAEKIVCVNTTAISTYRGPSHRRWKLRGEGTRWRRKIWRMRESLKREINQNGKTDTEKQKGEEGETKSGRRGTG